MQAVMRPNAPASQVRAEAAKLPCHLSGLLTVDRTIDTTVASRNVPRIGASAGFHGEKSIQARSQVLEKMTLRAARMVQPRRRVTAIRPTCRRRREAKRPGTVG